MSRPFDFSDITKRQAFMRQHNLCAHCGHSLLNAIDHAHHVVPNQAGRAANPQHAWLREVDNCVVLCDTCHHRVHENGNYRNGAVPLPKYYPYSHGRQPIAHMNWANKLDTLATALYGR